MAKKVTTVEAQNAFNDLMVQGSAAVTFDEAFEILETSDSTLMQELTSEYFSFDEIGQVVNAVVEGFDTANINGKAVEVVKMRFKDGSAQINGDKMLVSACKRLQQLPAYIRVEYKGDTKNAVGTYKNLTVKTFPVK